MKNRITQTFISFSLMVIVLLSACSKPSATTNPCSTLIGGSWKVNGTNYLATSLTTVTSNSSNSNFYITGYACLSNTTGYKYFNILVPQRFSVGTYSLSAKPTYLGPAGANYISNTDSFATDANHTGSLTITSINTVDSTYSATFYFSAVSKNASVVTITNGVLTNLGF